MSSWIYILSKFTPEALLFEVLAICGLCAAYAAFWILHKRRMGAVDAEVPASVVKLYLSELIGDAEKMRAQLFGLLGNPAFNASATAGASIGTADPAAIQAAISAALAAAPAPQSTTIAASDPAVAEKVAALETQMANQAKAMETILLEKQKLEKQLAEAKSAGAAAKGAPAAGGNSDLSKRLKELEDRLAEYAVIEDDLANLKRLQQENAQLKAALAGQGGAPVATAAAAAPAAEPAPVAAAEPAPAAEPAAAPEALDAMIAQAIAEPTPPAADPQAVVDALMANPDAPAAEPAPAPAPEPAAPAPAPAAAPAAEGGNSFEALVDQVESSIAKPAEAASTTPDDAAKLDKSDADLVAEFEKMLSS